MQHRAVISKIRGNESIEKVADGIWRTLVDGQVKDIWFDISPIEAKQWMKENKIRWIRFELDKMEKEKRILSTEFRVETRDSKQVVEGVAAVFNSLSEDLGGFREKINPGAFDSVLADDVRALKNHNPDWVLGRTRSGTLELFLTDNGLGYRYTDPETTYSNDLVKSMKRGDVDQSSFAFTIAEDGDIWEKNGDSWIRTITKVERLYDVSPVTYPAYPDTKVAARSLEAREQEIKNEQSETEKRMQAEQELIDLEQDLLKIALSGKNK